MSPSRPWRPLHAEMLAILDVVPAALIILNSDGSIRLQNKAAERLLGKPPASPKERKAYWDAFSVRDAAGRSVGMRGLAPVRALSGAEIAGEEAEVRRPDGTTTTILIGAMPLRDGHGRITGAVAAFQDITRLREIDRLKDQFVAVVSHELRTPLTAIRGSLQLLTEPGAVPDADNRELVTAGLDSCERLVRIVNDVLDVSKIEAGALQLRLASLDVGMLIGQAIETLQPLADRAGVTLAQEIAAVLPPVLGDQDRVTHALVNLLSNALKYAPPGSSVTVSAHERGTFVAFSVTDRGCGIPPAEIARLFQKFHQVEHADARRAGGTGLGLAIAKGIVERHGGTIEVRSKVGQGTTFTFTIPRAAAKLSREPTFLPAKW